MLCEIVSGEGLKHMEIILAFLCEIIDFLYSVYNVSQAALQDLHKAWCYQMKMHSRKWKYLKNFEELC